ncbi:MAG: hypothetical protein J07HX64_00091 [halophilic archaeon J07HX64]|jgi:hypothetical protein|nr:MAG: hypothetical protein J07HX64_00091 [halophilic archaeon J07HX64]
MVEEAAVSMGVNLASTAVCKATALGRGKGDEFSALEAEASVTLLRPLE